MVFEHQESRTSPDEQMSRDEYVDLMKLLRPKVSERLGVREGFYPEEQNTHICL